MSASDPVVQIIPGHVKYTARTSREDPNYVDVVIRVQDEDVRLYGSPEGYLTTLSKGKAVNMAKIETSEGVYYRIADNQAPTEAEEASRIVDIYHMVATQMRERELFGAETGPDIASRLATTVYIQSSRT